MSRQWVRLYTEVPDDPKVQLLPDKLFKFWINCLCLAGRAEGVIPDPASVAWTLRKDVKDIEKMLVALVDSGLLETDGNCFRPHSWNARQYQYDVSTSRVKQFRERKRNVSFTVSETVSPSVSVSVLSSGSVSEKKNPPKHAEVDVWFADEFWPIYPKKVAKPDALKHARAQGKTEQLRAEILGGLNSQLTDLRAKDPQYIPNPATWLHQQRWKDSAQEKFTTPREQLGEAYQIYVDPWAHLKGTDGKA